MEICIKFTDEELKLIWQALSIGAVHCENDIQSQQMLQLMKKMEIIGALVHYKKT